MLFLSIPDVFRTPICFSDLVANRSSQSDRSVQSIQFPLAGGHRRFNLYTLDHIDVYDNLPTE